MSSSIPPRFITFPSWLPDGVLRCGLWLERWQVTRLSFEARLLDVTQDDAELHAAMDAALVAAYPRLARWRVWVTARRSLAKSDDGALTQAEVEHLRFIAWLIEQGRIGVGDMGAEPEPVTTSETDEGGAPARDTPPDGI